MTALTVASIPETETRTMRSAAVGQEYRKLNRVLDIIKSASQPYTISDISKGMYPDKHGYEILMALEETGAHVEYLYQHGHLAVSNLDEVEQEDNPALRYSVV